MKTATSKSGVTGILLAAATIVLIWASTGLAQQSLGELIKQYQADWLIGRWSSVLDKEKKVQLVYKWQIENHLLAVDFAVGDYRLHGLIFFVPGEDQVVEVAIDSKGGLAKGAWDIEGDQLVCTSLLTGPDGNTQKVAVHHAKIDDNKMKVSLYKLSADDQRAEQPWAVLEYKRKAPRPQTEKSDKQPRKAKKSS